VDEAVTSSDLVLIGSYDYRLVARSVPIAILASHCALDFGARVTAARGKRRLGWLIGGSIAMGVGIWSMHYMGMLAFRLPIPVWYCWPTVLVSLLAGVFTSAVAMFFVSRPAMGSVRALIGSLFIGGGIAALHYIAMAAMRLQAIVPLFSRNRDSFGGARDCDFSTVTMADIHFSGCRLQPEISESGKRRADGGGHSGYALHRHGCRHLCALRGRPGPVPRGPHHYARARQLRASRV
jgi:hypothetical protein